MRSLLIACALVSSALAQVPEYRVLGTHQGEFLGDQIDVLGDVDGDGIDDYIVSSPYDDHGGNVRGTAWVYSGAQGALLRQTSGTVPFANYAYRVSRLDDIDTDGRPDYLVFRPEDNGSAILGNVDAISGATGAILYTVAGSSPNSPHLYPDLDELDDVDGDGIADFVLGARWNQGGKGEVLVISGASGGTIHAIVGSAPLLQIGEYVAGVGDVDDDGRGDFAFTALNYPMAPSVGVFVYSGATATPLFSVVGSSYSGFAPSFSDHMICGAGDVDGDGFDDVAITDYSGNGNGGAVEIWSGATHSILRTLVSDCVGAPNGTERFGRQLANLGDIDGDGVDELGVGSQFSVARAFSGANGAKLYEFQEARRLAAITGLHGEVAIVGVNDLDGDGRRDVVVAFRDDSSQGSLMLSAGKLTAYSDGVATVVGTPLGFGDGSGAPCPCGNLGQSGGGCANSTGAGATLIAHGSTSVADDLLHFDSDNLGSLKQIVLVAGTTALNGGLGVNFGSGLLVSGGTTKRIVYGLSCVNGRSWTGSGLSRFGNWQAGDTRFFQMWYRDLNGPCAGGTNLSNAVQVTFTP